MWKAAAALLPLLFALHAGAARAELGLETVVLGVEVEGTKAVDTVFQVTVTVTGTDIAAATLTPQGGTALALSCATATSCTATQTLANQAALDALLPTTARNYTILLTGTATPPAAAPTVTDTISFARPAVPSPAISFPADGATIEPGVLTAQFLACASCTASTHTTLFDGATVIEETDLPASATSWKPATALGAESAFGLEVEHASGGTQPLTADGVGDGTEDDGYAFTHRVTHSDRVSFSTGFAPPIGDFCLAVNDDAADVLDPTGCTTLVEPAAGILVTSDSCSTVLGGVPIQYDYQLAANGTLSGIADADLDGDATFETHVPLAGRLSGGEGRLAQRLRVRLADASGATRLTFRLREQADLATLVGGAATPLEWLLEQRLRGKRAGARVDETLAGLRTLPAQLGDDVACAGGPPLTGWLLRFTLTGEDGPTTGSLELADGSEVALAGRQRFDFLANQTRLRLESKGAERGVRITVRRLEIDDTTDPDEIAAGNVHLRAFGQGGTLLVP